MRDDVGGVHPLKLSLRARSEHDAEIAISGEIDEARRLVILARAGETLPGESRPPIYNAIQVVDDEGTEASDEDDATVTVTDVLPTVSGQPDAI